MGEFDQFRDWDPLDHLPVDDAVRQTLRDLTVNLLRVSRGAGASYELIRQIRACDKAFGRYVAERGQGPTTGELNAMLEWRPFEESRGETEVWHGETDVVRAGLRIVAAELDGNRMQQAAGERDLREAIRRLGNARKAT